MQKLKRNRKAYTIGDIPWLAITFGIGVIVLSIVGQIVGDVKTSQTENSTAYNISHLGGQGVLKMANWMPTIGLVLGAVIVIVALSVLFVFKRQ